jgi:hypothetical protein
MDSLDNFRERFEALEQQTEQLKHQTQALERRLRWWRGMACGVVLLSLLSLALPSGKAADTPPTGLADQVAALQEKLKALTFDDATNEVVITGANLRIVNGLGSTETTNGVGNLIVGYNEFDPLITNIRTGSHNVVVGRANNFSSFGGLAVGTLHEISGRYSSVCGGDQNIASADNSSVCGGFGNTASGVISSISGGAGNTASGFQAAVSGGTRNTASGLSSSVSGGQDNTASGDFSSVSGGLNRTAPAENNWAAGALFSDM